jgi:hypothetical protein
MAQPFTIQFGAWSPDLANVAVQMQFQYAATEMPCADCQNVYYSNGNYKNLPTLSVSSTLNQIVLGAFTAIDPSGNPQVYAGAQGNLYWQVGTSWFTMMSSANGVRWSFAEMGGQVYATDASLICSDFLQTWAIGSAVATSVTAPFGNVVATVGQFIMLGNIGVPESISLGTGNGVTTTFNGTLTALPVRQKAVQVLSNSTVVATDNGSGTLSGAGVSGTINYATGVISVTYSAAPGGGVAISATWVQAFPQRLMWSAIGNGSNWPTPLTNAALAVQSGEQDLEALYGPVLFISGYPLYGVVFQRNAITRAQYIGAPVVFSWQTYSRNLGLITPGAAVQVGANTYFLSDQGFFYTDGANVVPIGTAQDNSSGIDNWFWANVNQSALSAISAAYDARSRCVFFAIPTGSNTLPDTLLSYNVLAGRWTKGARSTQIIWTDSDGSTDRIGAFTQFLGQYCLLTGTPASGYLESCDVMFTDGNVRYVTAARPNINAADTPTVTLGTRNTLESAVTYTAAVAADTFGAGFAPLFGNGLYMRARVTSAAAQAMHGATLMIETGGPV